MADTLAALRAQIRTIEGRPVVEHGWTPSGVEALDAVTQGLPRPGLVEIAGPLGSGRTRLALALAAACSRRDPIAWIDVPGCFYPPTAIALGVEAARLYLVRPAPEKASWSVEQSLRSGCFPIVVADGLPEEGGAAARWQRAATLGASTLVILSDAPLRDASPALRLLLGRGVVSVQRHRAGRVGRSFPVPAWPDGLSPWR